MNNPPTSHKSVPLLLFSLISIFPPIVRGDTNMKLSSFLCRKASKIKGFQHFCMKSSMYQLRLCLILHMSTLMH